jgi:hypothetical protein
MLLLLLAGGVSVKAGDVGRAGPPQRSEIDGFASMYAPGTEINVSYNFNLTSATRRSEATGMTIGQFHNDDGARRRDLSDV